MKLPKFECIGSVSEPVGNMPGGRDSVVFPSQVSIPAAIVAKLASDHAVSEVTGLARCVGTLAGILDNYQRCVDRGTLNCENIAARHIAEIACRSYCTCD